MALQGEKNRPLVLSFIASPVVPAPRPINAAIHLGNQGYNVILIGYRNSDQPKVETMGARAKILRIDLRSRRFMIPALRRIFATIEFIALIIRTTRSKRPVFVITFNEVATIALRWLNEGKNKVNTKKIAWLLEFPESYTGTLGEKILHRMSIGSWKFANALVFPTRQRMSMACVLEPKLIQKPTFVIHNTSLAQGLRPEAAKWSGRTKEALDIVRNWQAQNRIIVMYAGAVGNRYGWDHLIRAVGNAGLSVGLMILGAKHALGSREYSEAIKDVDIPENIQWIDAIPYKELHEVLSCGDIGFVHYIGDNLNTFFASPGKLYEYLKAGLLVLTDNQSCLAEELDVYRAGILFQRPLTTPVLQDILENLDRAELDRGKGNARRLFEAKFNFELQMAPLVEYMKTKTDA